VLILVVCVAMGVTFIWDVGGLASRMRARLDWDPGYRALYRRVPWMDRVIGVWWIAFGIGQLIYVYGLTYGKWK